MDETAQYLLTFLVPSEQIQNRKINYLDFINYQIRTISTGYEPNVAKRVLEPISASRPSVVSV